MEKPTNDLLQFSILNLDKPSGPTSFNVSDFVRKKVKDFGVGKTSHFGTLDPKVTGVLPIALGRACKLTGFFLGHNKEYIGIMHVHEEISIEKLQETINKKFLGKIMQKPPVKSNVKRELREREIISFEILEQDKNRDFLFKAKVQGGTYIRKLIDDLGTELGIGAHMLELRRTQAGIFSETEKEFVNLYDFEKIINEINNEEVDKDVKNKIINNSIKPTSNIKDYINNKKISEQSEPNSGQMGEQLHDITSKNGVGLRVGAEAEQELRKILIPAEEAIKKVFPVVQVKENEIKKLWTGKPLFKNDIVSEIKSDDKDRFALFHKEKFIGIYRKTNERGIFARPEFVMQPIK